MRVSLIFAVLFISLAICKKSQTEKQPRQNGRGREEDNGKLKEYPWKIEAKHEICNAAQDVSVHSVYFGVYFIQFFIETFDGSKGWTSDASQTSWPRDRNPNYKQQSSRPEQLGYFMKMDEILESGKLKDDGKFKSVSASFVHFSDSPKEFGYLVMGLSAYEFELGDELLRTFFPTGKVKPITDFFKVEDQLLNPEDKLEEVISVSLIKWVQKGLIKDHAIYKIVLKTVTRKLVKAYFKITSKGEVISLNSEPFVPSAEAMQDEDEFNLLEESALYFVRELDKLSMGYLFLKSLAFPIYYDYNPEENTYKEYSMKTKKGFNTELQKLAHKIPHWNRYIVPTETWLGCPDQTFCLGRSFLAVFYSRNQYYALLGSNVYTLEFINTAPGIGESLESLLPVYYVYNMDAAFSIGDMVFFIGDMAIYYKTDIGGKSAEALLVKDVFPGIDCYSVSAVITLDKEKEAGDVHESEPQPSKLKSAKLRKYPRKYKKAAETTKEEIPKNSVYVYCSNDYGGKVYQYEMETKNPPKFKLIAIKPYNEVNAALPFRISLAFTAEDKVVTMVNHFMIEQSSQTFFTQTESLAKFTLVDKYFGCHSQNLVNELTKEFVQNYIEFASPKPGIDDFDYPPDTQGKTETTTDDEGNNENSTRHAQISTASFIIQAVVIILFGRIVL